MHLGRLFVGGGAGAARHRLASRPAAALSLPPPQPQARRSSNKRTIHDVAAAAAAAASASSPPPMVAMTADLEEAQERELAAAMAASAVSPNDLQALLQELGVRYDPDALASALSPQWPALTKRAATVAAGLSTFAAKLATDLALGRTSDPEQQSRRARELLALVSRLGPSFVKIGQALSARPDLLPRPYLEALSELQDRIAPFDDATAYKLIEQELGAPVSEVYSELSASPVAAASLGQVYKGVHRSTGMRVAVKVQRPGIGEQVAVDMVLLRRLTRAVDAQRFVSQPLTPLVDEFAARLFGELDYVQEGRNCERFKELYGSIPRVSAPDVVWGATARRVLTMSWVEGVKLTDVEGMREAGLDVLDFVDVGVQCTLEQMLGGGAQRVFVSSFRLRQRRRRSAGQRPLSLSLPGGGGGGTKQKFSRPPQISIPQPPPHPENPPKTIQLNSTPTLTQATSSPAATAPLYTSTTAWSRKPPSKRASPSSLTSST
jgi:hypothetical protein